jgi:hypothetical protein
MRRVGAPLGFDVIPAASSERTVRGNVLRDVLPPVAFNEAHATDPPPPRRKTLVEAVFLVGELSPPHALAFDWCVDVHSISGSAAALS